jgi:hypothetical protein
VRGVKFFPKQALELFFFPQNLYGYAMSEKMPVDGFEWIDDEKLKTWTRETLLKMDASEDKGYILEVDIEIPASIHESTNDYPLCPEQLEITDAMISPECRFIKSTFIL